uniref:Endoribonuclease n=1 Tax=Rhabditophanes sp. KR3021 TaxID=114890 RepID=A0AC35UHW8_9BILA
MKIVFIILAIFILNSIQESIPAFDILDYELIDLVNKLRELDNNKAEPGQISLNYQGHTTTRDVFDNAKLPLFKNVNQNLLRRKSYASLIKLMDNYEADVASVETSTPEEEREISEFLLNVFKSPLSNYLYEFLQRKNHPYAVDKKTYAKWMRQLWFGTYSRARGVQNSSSGFEHVFIGEIKNEVIGMHNWLRFYILEKNSTMDKFDYKGFLVKRFNLLAAVKYSWLSQYKKSGSFLIGSSPEFDFSLYTLCFLSRRGMSTCNIEIDNCPLSITSYDMIQNGKVFIGTMFPSAGRITESCKERNG